ncbi:MAG: YeeE/YedE family protein [Candidatus Cyclobacteriaceae bacterium M3_2C_046]
MMDLLLNPWPWYVSGALIGLMVPLLLLFANKSFGISSSLRHICAACFPSGIEFFKYNWKRERWNLFFVVGIILGGYLGQYWLPQDQVIVSAQTIDALKKLGVEDMTGILPESIFSWQSLKTFKGFTFIILGGFLVGFGTRYANGCTSGHAIMGLSNLQPASLVAVIGFFVGGLIMTHLFLPFII